MNKIKKKTLFDFVLVASIAVIAIVLFIVMNLGSSQATRVRVSVDGVSIGEFSLYENRQIVLNDGTNTLAIENGCAYMISADCHDETCIRSGKINRTGQRIVCLPNKIVVEAIGNGEEILGG